jgi:hypothetical protein
LPNKSLDFFIFGTYVYFSHKLLAVHPKMVLQLQTYELIPSM